MSSLGLESLGLLETTGSKVIVVALEYTACSCEHIGGIYVIVCIAVGESPHVIGGTAALSIGRFHILGQAGIIVQAIGNGGGVTQVMVVVKHRVGQCL